MTTHAEWITALVSTMTVAGVTRQYSNAPASLSTGDLPASFPEGYRIDQESFTFKAHGGLANLTLDLVIATEPYGQGTSPQNFTEMVTLGNALDSALRAATAGQGKLTWDIKAGLEAGLIEVAGNAYWGIRATITGKAFGPQ